MDINDKIRYYNAGNLNNIFDKWSLYVINPYNLAYQTAFDKFKETLDAQKAFDKMQMELVFTALSLCGGSIFTAAFGAITAKKLVGDVAVDFICKYNMERAFKMAAFVSENKTAEFIIGGVWDKSASLLGDKIKNSLQENATNFPAIEAIVKKPYEIAYALEQFRLSCKTRYFDTLDALLEVKDNNIKSTFFELIKKSSLCSPPKDYYYPLDLDERIELSFYMRLILNTDHLVTRMIVPSSMGMMGSGYIKTASKAISATPDQKIYPTGSSKSLGWGSTEITSVEYDRIGQDIIDRINALHKKIYYTKFIDSDYFGETMDKNTLFRATQVLNSLATYSVNMIQQQMVAK